jgi:predicted nucleotidyltransferase component of viral defense system
MISKEEINRRAKAEGLRFDQIEKDHVILWILQALAQPELKPKGWVFKGGTCLRHCFYSGYRFSEDLDYSCREDSGGLDRARDLLSDVSVWVQSNAFLRLAVKEARTIEGDFQVELPVEYSRGGARQHGLPEIKIHLTFDEPILTKPTVRSVTPLYSDLSAFTVATYTKEEILAEKMRALLQQQMKWPRPRDLYDLWFILCHENEKFDWENLRGLFDGKCRARKIDPDPTLLVSDVLKNTNERVWNAQLSAVMATVSPFAQVWQDWGAFCKTRLWTK